MSYSKETARHEAAHFVVHWALEIPAFHIDITQAVGKINPDILGITSGCSNSPTPFTDIIVSLAGPMADHWENGDADILKLDKDILDDILATYQDGNCLHSHKSDWESCIKSLVFMRIDILDPKQLNDALLLFLGAVRAILSQCKTQWDEVTEYLVEHGRIGFNGEHKDSGEGAEEFLFRWGEWYQPPKEVKAVVARFHDAAVMKYTQNACNEWQ